MELKTDRLMEGKEGSSEDKCKVDIEKEIISEVASIAVDRMS